MPARERVSPRPRSVEGTRIKGMPRWLISTSIVLRSQMARMARLHSSPVIVHTSVRLLICLLVSILTQLEGWMQQASANTRSTSYKNISFSPESLQPPVGGYRMLRRPPTNKYHVSRFVHFYWLHSGRRLRINLHDL